MAPVLSRSMATASLASLPSSSSLLPTNAKRASTLRSAFLPPQPGPIKCFFPLKWNKQHQQRINNRVSVRCEAAVAEKEEATDDAPGEKFEYQAEVGLLLIYQITHLFALLGHCFCVVSESKFQSFLAIRLEY